MRCRPCLVGWASSHDGPLCWVCGEPGEPGDVMDVGAFRPSWQQAVAMQWTYVSENVRRLELGEVA